MAKAGTALIEDEIDEIDALEEETQDDLTSDDQDDDQDDEDQNGSEEEVETEIFLDGDDGSHPPQDEQRGIRKRINKLNAKIAKAETGAEQTSAELEVERERNRLLQLALDSQDGKKPDGPPDPNDYEDGVTDPGWLAAYQEHIAKGVEIKMQQQGEQRTIKTTIRTMKIRTGLRKKLKPKFSWMVTTGRTHHRTNSAEYGSASTN